uniref:Uncharacterized protein n=1 Tax=Setaria digitata TaxID=48799 RepID=A0A915PS24_9BILA
MSFSNCNKKNAVKGDYNDNFANILRQIETETQKDLENPLQYQLIPQRYRMKCNGYAVCRPCAEQSRHQSVPLSANFSNFNLMDYLRESSPERPTRAMDNSRYYLTVELGCCLARLTRLIFTSVQALKELKFLSGDIYPMLNNDITYLNGLYLRMKSSYTQYCTMKMNQVTLNEKAIPLTVEDVELFKNSVNANDEMHCNLTIAEDVTVNGGSKRPFQGSLFEKSNKSKSESDFEQYRTRKQKLHAGPKWKRDE